jgi:hypothetical protein
MTESDSSDLGPVAMSAAEGAKHNASDQGYLDLAAHCMKTMMGMDGLSRADFRRGVQGRDRCWRTEIQRDLDERTGLGEPAPEHAPGYREQY